jgi:hypothetical protein
MAPCSAAATHFFFPPRVCVAGAGRLLLQRRFPYENKYTATGHILTKQNTTMKHMKQLNIYEPAKTVCP